MYLLVVPSDLDSLLLAEQTTAIRFVGRYDLCTRTRRQFLYEYGRKAKTEQERGRRTY